MPRRPCLECKRLTLNASRCDSCQAEFMARRDYYRGSATSRGYTAKWNRLSQKTVQAHISEHGWNCPGWGIPVHPATDLTTDHIIPKALGGTDEPGNLRVLCRSCNGRKAARSSP